MKEKKPKRKMTEKQLAALRAHAYKPGQSGNLSGYSAKPISNRYRSALEVPLPEPIRKRLGLRKGTLVGDAIAEQMSLRAVDSRQAVDAAREIREAVEGKAPQALRIQSSGTVKFEVEYLERSKTIDGDAEYIDDDGAAGTNG